MQVTNEEKFSVDAYSFVDALQAVQKGVQQGYVLDVETNENYPQQWGTRYLLTMVRPKTEEVKKVAEMTLKIDASAVQEVVDKAVAEVKEMVEKVEQQDTKGKPGRKPKQG